MDKAWEARQKMRNDEMTAISDHQDPRR